MPQDNNHSSILFTIGALDGGGVTKSLLSLLDTIDKEEYNVSLLIGSYLGKSDTDVPAGVQILKNNTLSLLTEGVRGLPKLIKKGHILLAVGSIIRIILSAINKGWAGWWLSRLMPSIDKEEYDLIVDYNGQHMLYYMIDKLRGKHKVTFFHSDYQKWLYYYAMDKKYFEKADAIFTISETCVQSLQELFPGAANKVKLMENISNPRTIEQKSLEHIDFKRKHQYMLLSLGHICINKGSDIALEVAVQLKKKGIDFEWLFAGSISKDMDYLHYVEQRDLNDNIRFLGPVKNPYPYIKEADIFVHLSRFEGKSIALDEAKILCKPIVVTNFSSVHDQFEDGMNASICEMNVDSATQHILELLHDKNLQDKYIQNLKNHISDNTQEVHKLLNYI
jgi:putative capsular polysaccharide biosynthesis protein